MISFDPNISDELFAAFLDGKTTGAENDLVEEALTKDNSLLFAKNLLSPVIDGDIKLEDTRFEQHDNFSAVPSSIFVEPGIAAVPGLWGNEIGPDVEDDDEDDNEIDNDDIGGCENDNFSSKDETDFDY